MNGFVRSIGRGFAGLLRFGGRDRRGEFWPYAVFVYGLGQIAVMMTVMPALMRFQMIAFQQIGSGAMGPGRGQAAAPLSGDLGPLLWDMAALGAAFTAAIIILLAAAVSRRLHDCDRPSYWGLLPIPFLAAGLLLSRDAFAGFGGSGRPDTSAFFGLMVNNLLYLGALGWLIYLLVGEGTRGPNRFGPPPAS